MVHEPLSTPARDVKPLNPEAQEIIDRAPVGGVTDMLGPVALINRRRPSTRWTGSWAR